MGNKSHGSITMRGLAVKCRVLPLLGQIKRNTVFEKIGNAFCCLSVFDDFQAVNIFKKHLRGSRF
jgi:hypothetical protein